MKLWIKSGNDFNVDDIGVSQFNKFKEECLNDNNDAIDFFKSVCSFTSPDEMIDVVRLFNSNSVDEINFVELKEHWTVPDKMEYYHKKAFNDKKCIAVFGKTKASNVKWFQSLWQFEEFEDEPEYELQLIKTQAYVDVVDIEVYCINEDSSLGERLK